MTIPVPGSRPLPASAQAYALLRDAILSGRLRPGHARRRTKSRYASGSAGRPCARRSSASPMKACSTVRPQVATTVAPIDVEAVADGQFLREAIECRTVALAAER